MNTAIQAKIEAVEDFIQNKDRILLGLVRSQEDLVLDLNRQGQLYNQGQDAQGQEITPKYTPFTVKIKRIKGQPTDRVTLEDTGDFYRSFEIKYSQNFFEIVATDGKTTKLQNKYGKEILGLDEDSLQLIIDLFKDELIAYLEKSL